MHKGAVPTSSMNTMEGECSLAREKSWDTSFSLSPIHLDTRSEEDTVKKVDSASVATACREGGVSAALQGFWQGGFSSLPMAEVCMSAQVHPQTTDAVLHSLYSQEGTVLLHCKHVMLCELGQHL